MASDAAGFMEAGVKRYDAKAEYFFAEGCYITELSNSEDDPDVSVARARLEPGKTTRWHYLKGTSERYVVLSGSGSVEVREMPAQSVAEGDVVLIPPEARQRIKNTGSQDLVFLAICSPRFTPRVYVDIEG